MLSVGETGSVCETRKEVHVAWQIPDFFDFSVGVDSYFESPLFYLSDSCWYLRIFPYGRLETSDWVAVYLARKDSGPPKNVRMSLRIKKIDGEEEKVTCNLKIPDGIKGDTVRGFSKFILRADLIQKRPELTPPGGLTITCILTSSDPLSMEVCLFRRLWNLSRDLKTILEEKKGTDFVLKLNDGELHAHRTILESRCIYFARMLGNDFQEKAAGDAHIDDIEEGVFQCILSYIYTGVSDGMSCDNVSKIYVAADRLLLYELMEYCAHYMGENLSPDLICDVIAIVKKYEEPELEKRAINYFTRHADEIFESDTWKKFKVENDALVSKLLEEIIVTKMKPLKV